MAEATNSQHEFVESQRTRSRRGFLPAMSKDTEEALDDSMEIGDQNFVDRDGRGKLSQLTVA